MESTTELNILVENITTIMNYTTIAVKSWNSMHCSDDNYACQGRIEIALRVTLLVVQIFLAFFGNVFVLLVLYRNPKLMNIANKFVCNLLVADLLQSVVVVPFAIVSSLHSRWIYSELWCKLYACLTHVFAFAAVYTIVIVAIDRYLAILHPLSYHSRMTPTTSTNLMIGTWILAILQSTPPFYGWGEFGWHPARGLCTVLWFKHTISSFSFTIFISLTTFFIPLLIMFRGYWKIFRAAYRQNSIHPLPDLDVPRKNQEIKTNPQKPFFKRRSKRRYKRDMKAAKVVFIVMGSFATSIGPYTVVNLLEASQKWLGDRPTLVHTITLILLFYQCCAHPCIYGYMHRSIRRDLVYLICGYKCPCLLPKPRKDSIMMNRQSAAYTDEWRTSGATLSHIPSQLFLENSEMMDRELMASSVPITDEKETNPSSSVINKPSNGSNVTTTTLLDNDVAEANGDTVYNICGRLKQKTPQIRVRFSDA
ncbi:putative G-protein coupled receptor 101 [Saccoglossus kowalevskii]|uniref:G-protein coupled receptor 101-like protein n=1 Tax=Saccoglossus kowalevskii TaxID=10224 RepID=A0A1B1JCF5_SACKO|nr:PREDICTED: probable G-protein coupled receptor 101-like [Saccoglossus kowalevskii]ANS11599.1 G-protein coupled receptor 101-like protein [Saccoglossus kowalevskii]